MTRTAKKQWSDWSPEYEEQQFQELASMAVSHRSPLDVKLMTSQSRRGTIGRAIAAVPGGTFLLEARIPVVKVRLVKPGPS